MANIPSVILHCRKSGMIREPYRIEMTRYRLFEVDFACIICLFYQAIAPAVMGGSGKNTIFAVDNLRHPFARRVEIRKSAFFHRLPCLFGHIREQNGQYRLQFLFLFIGQRSPRIAFDTATPFATFQIATELFFEYVKLNNGILDMKHNQAL